MRQIKKGLLIALVASTAVGFMSCGGEEPSVFVPPIDNFREACEVLENGWTIPTQTVVDGGVGKDGIPSIDNPLFVSVSQVQNLQDDELVIVVKVGDVIKAYPQRILDQHEIVNDMFEDKPIAVTLCPQTGTALAFNRAIGGEVTTLGVSGLLYNSNLVMYDRNTDTKWAQMTTQAINGELACQNLEFLPVLEMSWAGVKTFFPNALVLSGETGFSRNYVNPPFSSQVPINSVPAFPYSPKDSRMSNYERAHIIIDSVKAQVYSFDQFVGEGFNLTIDNSTVLLSHSGFKFIISYKANANTLQLASNIEDTGIVMEDSEGNGYNLFGEVVSGEGLGERLGTTFSYMGYWFSLASMFPDPIVFQEEGED